MSMQRAGFTAIAQVLVVVCSLSARANLAVINPAPAAQEIFRFRGDLYRDFPDEIYINRMGQLVTVLDSQPLSTGKLGEYLLCYSISDGVSQVDLPFDHRVLSLSLSDWGPAVVTASRNSHPFKVVSARFGQPLQELFNLETGTIGRAGINDDGVVAFASRSETNHGLRDLWRHAPGSPLTMLPDVGEDSLRGPTLVDNSSRVIQSHAFGGILDEATMRLETNGQWRNLTETFGPSNERVLDIVGTNAINAAGDFAFVSVQDLSGGQSIFYLNEYSATSDTISRVYSSTTINLLNEINQVSLADNGDILFRIHLGITAPRFAELLYRKTDESIIDLQSFPGSALSPFPAMNQNGDVVFGTGQSLLQGYSYFVLRSGSSTPVPIPALQNLSAPLNTIALANDRKTYFWKELDNDQWSLSVAALPEPSCLQSGLAAVAWLSFFMRRKSPVPNHLDKAR